MLGESFLVSAGQWLSSEEPCEWSTEADMHSMYAWI